MSEDISNQINQAKKLQIQQAKLTEQNPDANMIEPNEIRVIITQNKNSSWIEDLDARERLNKCKRVYH